MTISMSYLQPALSIQCKSATKEALFVYKIYTNEMILYRWVVVDIGIYK